MRRFAAVAVVSLLGLVACKSTDETSTTDSGASETTASTPTSDDSTESTEFVSTDNRAPGVTDDTIRVGIAYQYFSDSLKAQLKTWHGDYQATFQAVIDAVNAEGGINGRMLEPVFSRIELGVDGAEDAACTALTEDTEVFVALGYMGGGESLMCYLDTHETAVIGGAQSDELRAQAKAPWFTPETQGGDAEGDGIRGLIAAEELTGAIGVIGATSEQAYYESVSRPLLDDAGIDVVDEAFLELVQGDTTVNQGLADTAIERFRAAGVETVLLIGSGVQPSVLPQLAKTDWRPALRFTSLGGVGIFAGDESQDRSILDGAVTVAGFDPADVWLEMTDEPTASCVAAIEAAGLPVIARPDWTFDSGIGKTWVSAGIVCSQVQLLVAILEAAGPNLDYGTFQHAGENLGEVFLFGDTKPRTYGPGSAADGDPVLYRYDWDATALKFVLGE